MSSGVIGCHMMSSVVTCCHLLLFVIICCHLMSLLQDLTIWNFLVTELLNQLRSLGSCRGVFTPKNNHHFESQSHHKTFSNLSLGLEFETFQISVLVSVSSLRLLEFQSQSRHWDFEDYSLGLSLDLETFETPVSVSKIQHWSRYSLVWPSSDPILRHSNLPHFIE